MSTRSDGGAEARYSSGLRGILRRHRGLYAIIFRLFSPVLVTGPDPARLFGTICERGGTVVDLGSGNDRRHEGFTNVDRIPFPEVDVVADSAALPFGSGTVDAVSSIVVLEHVPAIHPTFHEVARVLRPGGEFFVVVPFLQPFHAAPHDYRRWTSAGLRVDLEAAGFEVGEVGVYCGPASMFAWSIAELLALVLSVGIPALRSAIQLPLQALCSPIKWFDLGLARMPAASELSSAIYARAAKRSGAE